MLFFTIPLTQVQRPPSVAASAAKIGSPVKSEAMSPTHSHYSDNHFSNDESNSNSSTMFDATVKKNENATPPLPAPLPNFINPIVRMKRLKITDELKSTVPSSIVKKITKRKTKEPPSSGGQFKCVKCPKTFGNKAWLTRHQLEHLDSYVCGTCDKDFKDAALLQIHRRKVSRCRPHSKCEFCPKIFRELWQLTNHKVLFHNEIADGDAAKVKYYACDYCNRKYVSKLKLTGHMSQHTNARPFQCDLCQRPFFAKFQMENHRKTHTAERSYCCELCPKRYISQYHLTTHMKVHRSAESFHCVHCGKAFVMLKHLQTHERLHTNEKANRFPCNQCDKSFEYKSLLVTHMRQHTGERPFGCTDCSARFADRSNLKKHFRIHAGVKPYKCSVCDRRFNQLSSLRGHKKSHVEYKAFECSLCGKRFIDDDDLTLHLRREHGASKLFKCTGCDKEFDQLSHMKSHRRLHFGIAIDSTERDYSLSKFSNDLLKQREMGGMTTTTTVETNAKDLKCDAMVVEQKTDVTPDVEERHQNVDEVASNAFVQNTEPPVFIFDLQQPHQYMQQQLQQPPQSMWLMGPPF